MEELKLCLQELQVEYSDEEIEEFHHESDMDSSHGIQFKEFIVVLALIYLFGRPTHTGAVSSLLYHSLMYRFISFQSGLKLTKSLQHAYTNCTLYSEWALF